MRGKPSVPSARCLLETVEGLVEPTDMSRKSRINKPCGLRTVHCFRQNPMEEGVLHIKLMNRPVPGVSQGEDSANGGRLDDRAECLVIVNTRSLCKSAKDPTGFVSVQGAISMELMLEYPFPSNHICLRGSRNEIPSVVVL
jgi:hypothetical protein